MSEEVLAAIGTIEYWQHRAEQAEALARTLQAQRDQAEADAAALRQMSDESIKTYCGRCGVCHRCIHDLPVLNADRPGAALLAELEAARAYMAHLGNEPPTSPDPWPDEQETWSAWATQEAKLRNAYDAAVKASRP